MDLLKDQKPCTSPCSFYVEVQNEGVNQKAWREGGWGSVLHLSLHDSFSHGL